MRKRIQRLVLVLIGSLLVFFPAAALADSPPVPEIDRFPRLGDHRFTPNNLTNDPFIKTYVRNSLGLGRALNLVIPVLEIDGEPVLGLKGDLVNAILEFEYQQAVKNWVAFLVQVRILGRLGNGTEALLAQGVTTNMGYELGWMFRFHHGEKTALSGTLNVWNTNNTAMDPLGWANGVITGTNVPLIRKTPLTRGGGGLRYAWAVSRLVGVNLNAETGMGESPNRTEAEKWFVKGGFAVDFDLKAKTSVPLGLVVGYAADSFPEGGESLVDVIHETFFRISYTGTTDFLISFDVVLDWFKLENGGKSNKLASILINLRYYF